MVEIFGDAIVEAGAMGADVSVLRESFDRVMGLLSREDQGWDLLFGGGTDDEKQFGLTLKNLKPWSLRIREWTVGAPWGQNGFRLKQSYIWRDGIRYGNIPKADEGTKGKVNIAKAIATPGNQRSFFGSEARRRRELCLFADGVAFWIGDNKTKQLEAIPLRQIVDQLLEPSGLGYAIAYKREWSETNIRTGESKPMKAWYFTDTYEGKKPDSILEKNQSGKSEHVPVIEGETIFDQHANQGDHVYGAPDAIAAWVWAEIARDAMMDGVSMQRALAVFALKATNRSVRGGANTSLALASAEGAGNLANLGGAQDLVPLASAGKGYDFGTLRPVISMVATALGVSVIHLTSNPADAGSSYGSAATLDLPTRLAIEMRRQDHVEFDKRVLRWMGMKDEEPEVYFLTLDDGAEIYRAVQGLVLEYQQDILDRQELRDQLDDLHGRPNGTVPTEAQRPSVLLAAALAKVEAQNAPAPTPQGNSSTPSPNQGQSNGTGGQSGAANDLRDDGIS